MGDHYETSDKKIVDMGDVLYKLQQSMSNKGVDVNVQDQTSKIIIQHFNIKEAQTTLSAVASIDDMTITVDDATGFVKGKCSVIFSTEIDKVTFCNVLSVSGNVVTIDTPIDGEYPVGSIVTAGIKQLNVNGSVTRKVFGLRTTEQHANLSFDITRIIFAAKTSGTCDMSKFGDITGGLAKGIVLRHKNGGYDNIFNAKTNGNLMNLMYDLDLLSASNPQQGQNGFKGRMTFAGQNKMGVAIRLNPGEDLQLIIQDDLSSLEGFTIIAEGHIVE